ncbi:MAG: nucleotidyltransferase domain-containing protein [Hyphomonadaceae bacterium]
MRHDQIEWSNRDELLAALLDLESAIATKYKIRLKGLVGSWAREDASATSDIDIVYTPVGRHTLFDLGGADTDLSEALGCKVDLIDWLLVKPGYLKTMKRDLVELHG